MAGAALAMNGLPLAGQAETLFGPLVGFLLWHDSSDTFKFCNNVTSQSGVQAAVSAVAKRENRLSFSGRRYGDLRLAHHTAANVEILPRYRIGHYRHT